MATQDYYKKNAVDFFNRTVNLDVSHLYKDFLKLLPDGALILDAGCGSGRDSKAFLGKGYQVEAFDSSAELCDLASTYTGIEVECQRFEDFSEPGRYNGIWALASLLHVPKGELSEILTRFTDSLKSGGILYCSFKAQNENSPIIGDRVGDDSEQDDRDFTYLSSPEAHEVFSTLEGVEIVKIWESEDQRRTNLKWTNVLVKK